MYVSVWAAIHVMCNFSKTRWWWWWWKGETVWEKGLGSGWGWGGVKSGTRMLMLADEGRQRGSSDKRRRRRRSVRGG